LPRRFHSERVSLPLLRPAASRPILSGMENVHNHGNSTRSGINQAVAARFREAADLLEQQAANPFRIAAYRRAAATIAALAEDLGALVEEKGAEALVALPGIGRGIAAAIDEILRTGTWSQLDRLRGSLDPERLFQSVPAIGPQLAKRIHDTLNVDTLEALEVAAHDGRLESVPGLGVRRATAIRATLGMMLGRVRGIRRPLMDGPPVGLLLEVDREYRKKAEARQLPTIAPRRFNPQNEPWLPVLHTRRGDWHFTLLYSNTARAHELQRTRDWVVVYFYDDHHQEGQHTVVTESRGPVAGKRVVRGREAECRNLYAARNGHPDSTI
jgi:DNA polymerase (family 10)